MKRLVQHVRDFVGRTWRPVALFGGLFAGLSALLYYRLGTLLPGFAPSEAAAFQDGASMQVILNQPLNAPFTLLVYGLTFLSEHSLLLTRLSAVAFGLITLAAFCWLVNRWFGMRTAVLGTVLFGTSALFLHTARFGGPEVLLFGILTLVACGVWLKQTSNPLALLLCFLVAGALLFVPGMVWFVLAGVLWQLRTIDRIFQRHLWMASLGGLITFGALAAIGWTIYKTPSLWKTYVGLPSEGWPTFSGVLNNLLDVPLALFVRLREAMPANWLGHLPILDALGIAMLLLGVFVCVKHFRLHRVGLLGVIFLLSIPLIALGGNVSIVVLLPFVYLLVAIGIDHLLVRWFAIFPRNPIAKGLGVALVSLAVIAACSYQLRHYFVAWPQSPQSKQIYVVPSDTIR